MSGNCDVCGETICVCAEGQSRLNDGLGVTGVGNWCAPGPASEQSRRWLLRFDDASLGDAVFENEIDALNAFGRAEAMGWNCHLFAHVPRQTHNV